MLLSSALPPQLVSGDVCLSGGRRCRMRMSTEGGVCVCECVQSLSQRVSSSDFCPPTLTLVPFRPPGLPAFGAHRILPHPLVRAGEGDWGHSKEAELKPSPGLLPNILCLSHPLSALTTGSCLFPRQFWGGVQGPPYWYLPHPSFSFSICACSFHSPGT